jgi:hypothetical protein
MATHSFAQIDRAVEIMYDSAMALGILASEGEPVLAIK